MAEIAVARRYAQALFDTASRAGLLERVEADLKLLDETLRAAPRLQRLLRAPTIPVSRKREVIRQLFSQRVSPLTVRLLELTVARRRERILPYIYAQYRRLADEARNRLPVQVVSAVPLSREEQESLRVALENRTGKQVILELRVQPEIVGGVVLRLGDTVIDGSVRTRLEQLRQRLLAGTGL